MDTNAYSDQIKALSPLDTLGEDAYKKINSKLTIHHAPKGDLLFSRGETDKNYVYLLTGKVGLFQGKEQKGEIAEGSEEALHPLAHQQPRAVTAKALTNVTYLKIESQILDVTVAWERNRNYEVQEISPDPNAETDDWMARLLSKPAFHAIPPQKLQSFFSQMEVVPAHKGDVIIRQGEKPDFFYILASGYALVTHTTPSQPQEIKLAVLKAGDSFGEDALISHAPRNATVTMASDGTLMRVHKEVFSSIIAPPSIPHLTYAQALEMSEHTILKWLDTRLPSEFQKGHLPNAINLPLMFLRVKFKTEINPEQTYILYCDNGARSAAATFFLRQRGVNAYFLKGGLNEIDSLPGDLQKKLA